MELKTKPRSRVWSRLHFVVRFLLLTGLLVGGAGFVIASQDGLFTLERWEKFVEDAQNGVRADFTWAMVPLLMMLIGIAVALLMIFIEVIVALTFVAGRRSAFGFNVLLQVGLAIALLVGVNWYAFNNPLRIDCTRADDSGRQKFTLPEDVRAQLSKLQGETTIVVYQRHHTAGQLNDKPDVQDYAAERVVVQKVKDLVDQFREQGAKFNVVVLDVEEEGFDKKLKDVTEDRPALKAAIDGAVENTIFFYAPRKNDKGSVQRLSFSEFYQLDKKASQDEKNLVLLNQGVEAFARKIVNIDEKRPKVAVAVIHDILATQSTEDDYTAGGLKKVLEAQGIDTVDLVLKKWGMGPPSPVVVTADESRYDVLDEEMKLLSTAIKNLNEALDESHKSLDEWRKAPLKQITDKYVEVVVPQGVAVITKARLDEIIKKSGGKKPRTHEIDEESRKVWAERIAADVKEQEDDLAEYEQRLADRDGEIKKLSVDDAVELKRLTDLEAKMDRLLADCDLLILPRMTYRNITSGNVIPPRFYKLDEAQANAVKKFMAKGKPVLACFGPTVADEGRFDPDAVGTDNVEKLFADLGIQFGKSVVLYDAEAAALAGQRGNQTQGLRGGVKLPPVEFEWTRGDTWPVRAASTDLEPNPIRRSMIVASRSAGKPLDLEIRHPRPVYYEPADDKKPAFSAELMMTASSAWNEDKPMPTEERTPKFEAPKPDDPLNKTRDEKRHGRFSIGVAVEENVPASWTDNKDTDQKVRVVALGTGNLFVGPELSPPKERLLLGSVNWLLGRDDRLASDEHVWKYPRVDLSEREKGLWHWGTQVGLPALFLYVGLVVLLVRRMR